MKLPTLSGVSTEQVALGSKPWEQANNHCFSMVSAEVLVSRSLPLLDLPPIPPSMMNYDWDT